MYYEVYLDELFMVLFEIHLLSVWLVHEKFGLGGKIWMMLLAAMGGSLFVILVMLSPLPYGVKLLGNILLPELIVMKCSFPWIRGRFWWTLLLWILGFELFLGGSITAWRNLFPVFRQYPALPFYMLWEAVTAAVCVWGIRQCRKRRMTEKQLYQVTLQIYGKALQVMGFGDTGNLLKEPCTGRPVVILDQSCVDFPLSRVPKAKHFLVPFRSVGQEHGLLEAMEIPEMTIQRGKEMQRFSKVLVALSPEKISTDQSFQMILHPQFLTYWEE